MHPSTRAPEHHRSSHRVVFIDLARALAVVFMLYGHTVSALLAPQYQTGVWFEVWVFQRGLTSSMFLLLSGFAFSVATTRHWAAHLWVSNDVLKRVRRFALLVALGYALHFPVRRLALLDTATDAQWQAFLAVDVLQLIGVGLLGIQVLVLCTRSRRVFTVVAFALVAAGVALTPMAWSVDWTGVLPPAIAAYLTPDGGSLFPLLPWAGFLLLGAALGQLYARWDAAHLTRYANQVLLAPGAAMVLVGLLEQLRDPPLFSGPGGFVPAQFLLRAGTCLVLLWGIAHASRRIAHPPRAFGAMAQETLLIYFVHLCIVYGSVWAPGLYQFYAAALGPGAVALTVIALAIAMVGLASYWNWFKHVRPRAARWVAAAALLALLVRLL